MSKILSVYEEYNTNQYKNYLKFIRKGHFYILLNEEAFWFANRFSFKITTLDKNTLKVGFPVYAQEKWAQKCREEGMSYIFLDGGGKLIFQNKGTKNIIIDTDDYFLTYRRILLLDKVKVEEKDQKSFLLKQKLEDIYKKMLVSVMKFPKKERFYLRGKLETIMLNILENTYIFAYEPERRCAKAHEIFKGLLVFREFFRLAYSVGNYMKDPVYLDISNDLVESMKITKTLVDKYRGGVEEEKI